MTAVTAASRSAASPPPPSPPEPPRRRWWRPPPGSVGRSWAAPTAFAFANAIAVIVVSPGVNDIWAALARESAVRHGVGLTYWFSWFSGASVPASYSVLEPFVSHLVGVRTLGAVSAIACTPLAWYAMRRSPRVEIATWIATVLVAVNLWSGRVPFVFGAAFAIAALCALGQRRMVWTLVLGILSTLGSPVSGAFLALALVGILVAEPPLRRACLLTLGALAASVIVVAVMFGTPGPQHFTFVEMLSCAAPIAVYLLTRPPEALKVTLWVSLMACPLLYLIPNGLGSNFQRFVWYCLPPIVVAYAGRRLRLALLSLAPIVVFGTIQTSTDIIEAASPYASPAYYDTLIAELGRIGPPLRDQRLEVVDDGTHAAAFTLLNHAMLARGWETQEDAELNPILYDPDLNAISYKVWLQDNAVGYVAISHRKHAPGYEYGLVANKTPAYLHETWHDSSWTMYRVVGSDHIVNPPVRVARFSQAHLVLQVPCRCTFTVRVHWSRYLTASTKETPTTDSVSAVLTSDGFGWTVMRTDQPGIYTLSGSLAGGLFK
jgi:hypothetical protein